MTDNDQPVEPTEHGAPETPETPQSPPEAGETPPAPAGGETPYAGPSYSNPTYGTPEYQTPSYGTPPPGGAPDPAAQPPYGQAYPAGQQPPPTDPAAAPPYGASVAAGAYGQQPPPYGQPGQATYGAPGTHPYGGPGYAGGPYIPPTTSNGKTVWIVIGAVLLLVLLFCGGCLALGVFGAREATKQIDEITETYEGPGAAGDPITVTEGQEFEIGDLDFESGWTVSETGEVLGLRASNDDSDAFLDALSLDFTFLRDGTEVGSAHCYGALPEGDEQEVSCISTTVEPITGFDEIQVERLY